MLFWQQWKVKMDFTASGKVDIFHICWYIWIDLDKPTDQIWYFIRLPRKQKKHQFSHYDNWPEMLLCKPPQVKTALFSTLF